MEVKCTKSLEMMEVHCVAALLQIEQQNYAGELIQEGYPKSVSMELIL